MGQTKNVTLENWLFILNRRNEWEILVQDEIEIVGYWAKYLSDIEESSALDLLAQ